MIAYAIRLDAGTGAPPPISRLHPRSGGTPRPTGWAWRPRIKPQRARRRPAGAMKNRRAAARLGRARRGIPLALDPQPSTLSTLKTATARPRPPTAPDGTATCRESARATGSGSVRSGAGHCSSLCRHTAARPTEWCTARRRSPASTESPPGRDRRSAPRSDSRGSPPAHADPAAPARTAAGHRSKTDARLRHETRVRLRDPLRRLERDIAIPRLLRHDGPGNRTRDLLRHVDRFRDLFVRRHRNLFHERLATDLGPWNVGVCDELLRHIARLQHGTGRRARGAGQDTRNGGVRTRTRCNQRQSPG